MMISDQTRRTTAGRSPASLASLSLAAGLLTLAACGHSTSAAGAGMPSPAMNMSTTPPSPDPRIGLKPGLFDAGQATWNMRLLSTTPASTKFLGITNSDLAFNGPYAIQGSYAGYQVWDISNPSKPVLKTGYYCPASQSDVSSYKNLLFVSGEGLTGRLDCGGQGVKEAVSKDRLRGLRIFDITDISNPRNVGNVQTCRGSHTHTLLVDPKDPDNVYIYISGSSGVRSPEELPGCSRELPSQDPNSALFRIEVIKVPLKHPEQAAIVSSPRIFNDLVEPPHHGEAPDDKIAMAAAKAKGAFIAEFDGNSFVLPDRMTKPMLDSIAKSHGATAPNAADSATLRAGIPAMIQRMIGSRPRNVGPTQCHDITVYPAIGLAGGACEGYGLLLDIRDPAHPKRIGAVSDSNFSYWHSATFNNDGTKILFTDEWGGGGGPKCRASDPKEWGADALFTLADNKMTFKGYYKLPAPQTKWENCVAHNGSLIPIPGRDVMVQSWYQGGVSVFDWTDAAHPKEIAFFDRGPADTTQVAGAGTWSVYWYNGVLVSSEMERGLDILELTPSGLISQNELDAAKTVHLDYLNTQGQPKQVWPASFALSRAYLDQLERNKGLSGSKIAAARAALATAEKSSGSARTATLNTLASQLDADVSGAGDAAKVRTLSSSVKALATAS